MIFFYTPSLRYGPLFSADATPYLPAMNVEEFQLLFAARLDVFDLILGHPTNFYLVRLHKDLTKILLPLPYDVEKGIQNLLGIVMDERNYKQRYCTKFPKPTNPNIYNKTIPNNATNVYRAKDEAVCTAKIAYYQLFAVANRET